MILAMASKTEASDPEPIIHFICPRLFGNFTIEIRVQSKDQRLKHFKFKVSSRCLKDVCPSWAHSVNSFDDNGVCQIAWTQPEAKFALQLVLELAHGDEKGRRFICNSTSTKLFYITELYEWLGRPQYLPSPNKRTKTRKPEKGKYKAITFMPKADIQEAVKKLSLPITKTPKHSDWILLGMVAKRFELQDTLGEIRSRLLLYCEAGTDDVAIRPRDQDGKPFALEKWQWDLISDARIIGKSNLIRYRPAHANKLLDDSFPQKRLDHLAYIFTSIRLFVNQLNFLWSGILVGATFYEKWEPYTVDACPKCEVPPLDILLEKLGEHWLWPVPVPEAFEASINEALRRLKLAIRDVQKSEGGKKGVGSNTPCNPLVHMCEELMRRMASAWVTERINYSGI